MILGQRLKLLLLFNLTIANFPSTSLPNTMFPSTLGDRACSCWYLTALSSLMLLKGNACSSVLSAARTPALYRPDDPKNVNENGISFQVIVL